MLSPVMVSTSYSKYRKVVADAAKANLSILLLAPAADATAHLD